jgi:hypothetical protein
VRDGGARQPGARDRRGGPNRRIDRVHRVRAARELVEQQLGPGIGERDLDLADRQVHLVGDRHRHGSRDPLTDLGTRQRE